MIHDKIWWGRVPGVPGVIEAYVYIAEPVDVTCDPAVQITNISLKETNVFVLSFSPLDLDPITTVTPVQIFKLAMCAKQKIEAM